MHTTRSFYSLGIPDDHHSTIEEKHAYAPPVPPIPAVYAPSLELPYSAPHGAAGDTFMGRMSRWQHTEANRRYTLEQVPRPAATKEEVGDESVYGGMATGQRDSVSTMDAQRWIDEYAECRETFRGVVSVLGRPHSHGIV